MRVWVAVAMTVVGVWAVACGAGAEQMLFDFESAADLKGWSMVKVPEVQQEQPAVEIELAEAHATSGKHSLKLTYAGGVWPAVGTTVIPVKGAWTEHQSLKADITVSRPCVVAFRALQEKSDPQGMSWEGGVSRWNGVAFLHAGRNQVQVDIHDREYAISSQLGDVTVFMILMLNPHPGESIFVDNIRLSADSTPKEQPRFQVLGTDLTVSGVAELFQKAPNKSAQLQQAMTAEQVEQDVGRTYEQLRKSHPKAVLAIFRQGQAGYDPVHPEAAYQGWQDTYVNVHSPLGPNPDIIENRGGYETAETFMRHRSQLIGMDLASIPAGSHILAAKFVMTVEDLSADKWFPGWTLDKPNMWVAEACNRPWKELEANGYQYAKDEFWEAMSGQSYYGEDPDYLPIYVAHGPANGRQFPGAAQPPALWWDFTEAARFWTDGKHENHGFFFHCGGGDEPLYLVAFTCQAKDMKTRPALMVIYEPGE